MNNSRACIELALAPRMLLSVANGKTFSCFDSLGRVSDQAGYNDLLQVREQLMYAIHEALRPLDRAQQESAHRWLDRVQDAALSELHGQPAAKGLRAIIWWLAGAIDEGFLELYAGSTADTAITTLMQWLDDTWDELPDEAARRMDVSAEKQARHLMAALRSCGYFQKDEEKA